MLEFEYRYINYKANATLGEKREAEHYEAYLLLDYMLKKHFKIENAQILKNDMGKPYIDEKNVFFSISHTNGMVCCAVADIPCGIDCEKITAMDNISRLSQRYFVGEELKIIKEASYSAEEFFKIWTCKEAIGKRLGCGFILAHKIDSTKENCKAFIVNEYIISVNI